MVAAGVGLEHGRRRLEERLAAGHREQRQLEQRQRGDAVGLVEGELGGDGGAAGVADDVGAGDTEVVEQRGGVGGVVGHADRRRRVGAAHPAPLVVADQLVALVERRLGRQRQEAIGQHGADQQHRLARPDHLVFQLDAVDRWRVFMTPPRDPVCGFGSHPRGVSKTVTAVTPLDRERAMSESAQPAAPWPVRTTPHRVAEWQVAFDLFQEADASGQVGLADLPVLADAAYGSGHLDVTIETWERAYAELMAAGEPLAAAGAAVRVAMHLLFDTALMAPVRGWLARAEQLLDDEGETPAHAWFAVVRSYERMMSGDRPSARPWARRAIEVGSRCDPAAAAIGRVAEARLLILDGEVERGLALLEEAGMAATSGDLDPLSTGVVYCELVCALQGLAQYDLAEQWTEAMERWSAHQRHRQPPRPVPGASCRDPAAAGTVPRGRGRGAPGVRGAAALSSPRARMADQRARPHPAAHGRRRRRGASVPRRPPGRMGCPTGSGPGAALAGRRRGRGGVDPRRARATLVGAFKELPPATELRRAPLLDVQVEIAIADGDIDGAQAAADELETVASRFQSKALAASAAHGRARVQLA